MGCAVCAVVTDIVTVLRKRKAEMIMGGDGRKERVGWVITSYMGCGVFYMPKCGLMYGVYGSFS